MKKNPDELLLKAKNKLEEQINKFLLDRYRDNTGNISDTANTASFMIKTFFIRWFINL
jgi:hypothetical protein